MTRALIVIDVQESFRARPLWETTSDLKITDQVNRLVRLSRQAGDLVVWVLHSEPGTGDVFDPVLGHVRLMEELERADGEHAGALGMMGVELTDAGAFASSELLECE
jgi:nicotinamidase-related amidase